MQLTVMLGYKIYGFLRTELLVRIRFKVKTLCFHSKATMKTQRFANI